MSGSQDRFLHGSPLRSDTCTGIVGLGIFRCPAGVRISRRIFCCQGKAVWLPDWHLHVGSESAQCRRVAVSPRSSITPPHQGSHPRRMLNAHHSWLRHRGLPYSQGRIAEFPCDHKTCWWKAREADIQRKVKSRQSLLCRMMALSSIRPGGDCGHSLPQQD